MNRIKTPCFKYHGMNFLFIQNGFLQAREIKNFNYNLSQFDNIVIQQYNLNL